MHKHLKPALFCLGLMLAAAPSWSQQQVKSRILDQNGLPKNIVFAPGVKATDGQALLQTYLPLDAADKMVLQKVTRPGNGLVVERYNQWIRGIKVAHGSFTITAKDGEAKYMTGRLYPVPQAGTEVPQLSEHDALTVALATVNGTKYMWEDEGANNMLRQVTGNPDTSFVPKGTLVWVEDFKNDGRDGQLYLAWRFDIYAAQPLKREEIFVSAKDGRLLLVNPRLYHAAGTGSSLYSGTVPINVKKVSATQYKLQDTVRGGGIFTLSFNNSTSTSAISEVTATTTTFGTDAAIDAHWGASMVYDYWKIKHNRYSIDDADFPLYSYVHYDNNFDNAFWNGSWMTYGDGSGISSGGFSPLTSLDVCAHEIGHGICSNTSDLIYYAESGAMNEGLSDIWGATIEAWADPHETDAKPKSYWRIGEEISSSSLRRMDNPNLRGNPDTYNGTYWTYAGPGCSEADDNCGVHNNSGVMNYWYYLTVTGGSGTNDVGNPFAVTGIGMDDAAAIVYLAELNVTSTANYADFRQATIDAAGALFGECGQHQYTVDSAWYAVGVGDGYLPCIPTITFMTPDTTVTEWANSAACPAAREIQIPIDFKGPAPTGGDATATITVAGGTAVSGVDYALGTTTFTFPAGSTATQYLPVTIFDNGAVHPNKTIVLNITVDPGTSNVTATPIISNYTISIKSDDNRPDTGNTSLLAVGFYDGTISNKSSPFRSERSKARSQFLLTADMLSAAGMIPGAPVTSIAFSVSAKNSTQPFSGYTVKMGNTSVPSLGTGTNWVGGLTEVYNGNYTTTSGWNTIPFNSGTFIWDGVSNVAIEVCFTNVTAGSNNDQVYGYQPSGYTPNTWVASNTISSGCAASYSSATTSPAMPIMRFQQVVPPTQVETSTGSTRTWTVRPGQEVYFYSTADSQLIAGIQSADAEMTCLSATVAQGGNGFTPLSLDASVQRSLKEVTFAGATPVAATGYEASLYFTAAELAGSDPASLKVLHTTALTDEAMDATNTVVLVPAILTSSTFTRFRVNATGAGRYFLVDGTPTLPASIAGQQAQIPGLSVVANPFHDQISIRYEVKKDVRATVQLMDVTGRVLYRINAGFAPQASTFNLPVGQLGLASGQYLLRVVTNEGTKTFKLSKL